MRRESGVKGPCEPALSTTDTLLSEMYRQSWMMEEGEEVFGDEAFEVTDWEFEVYQ